MPVLTSGRNNPLHVVMDLSLPWDVSTARRRSWGPPARATNEPMRLHGYQVGATCPKRQLAFQTLLRRPMTHYLVILPDADMPQGTVCTRQGFPFKDVRVATLPSKERQGTYRFPGHLSCLCPPPGMRGQSMTNASKNPPQHFLGCTSNRCSRYFTGWSCHQRRRYQASEVS